jgi:hypothetical protein
VLGDVARHCGSCSARISGGESERT